MPLEHIQYIPLGVNHESIAFDVYFKPTNTINSKFAFHFDYSTLKDAAFGTFKQTIDYEDYLLVSRNNEETIFSNDYLNYIRTGYNYDKKVRERTISKNNLDASIMTATFGFSAAAALPTGGISLVATIAYAGA